VVEYALLFDNATTAAKVGFFLEQHREYLMIEKKHLKELRIWKGPGRRYYENINRKAYRPQNTRYRQNNFLSALSAR